jgi:hypothetical protein
VVEGAIDNEKPPRVTVKFTCFDMEQEGAAKDDVNLPLPLTQPEEWEDFSIEIDTTAVTELKDFSFGVEVQYVTVGSGRNASLARFNPLLKDRRLTFQFTFFKEEGVVLADALLPTLAQNRQVELIDTNQNFTVTNCYMSESTFPEYTGDDIAEAEYSVTYMNGQSVWSRT